MKVSIITVCYNSDEFIIDTINSVNRQTYNDIEHIFVDGGSSDKTLEIIAKSSQRSNLVISEPDNGVYDAMNKGIGLASGTIICFLNSDDFYIDESVIADVVQSFEKTSADFLWGNLLFVEQKDTSKVVRKWISKALVKEDLYATHIPPHPCFFMTSKVAVNHGSFDLRFKIAADFDFMKKVILYPVFNGVYLNRYIVKMRLGGLSTSNNLISQNLEVFKSLKNSFPKYSLWLFVILKLKNKLPQKLF